MKTLRPPATCPACGTSLKFGSLLSRHRDSARCKAIQLANTILPRGLVPVQKPVLARTTDVESTLYLFGHTCELHMTRTTTSLGDYNASGTQAWTTPEGFALLEVVWTVSRRLGLSFPEAARRLHEKRDLIAPFETARRLGADDESLRALLLPIDYALGSDGKRRPRTPPAVFMLAMGR